MWTDGGQRPILKPHLSNKNVTPRVFTMNSAPTPLAAIKIRPLPGSQVFQRTGTIFELNSLFRCFHYIHIVKIAPPLGGYVFSRIWTIFKLERDNNKTNVLTKFYDEWTQIVTSRVFTRQTAPPTGGHLHKDWACNVTSTVFTSFELDRGIIGTNLLTKFHEDRKEMLPLVCLHPNVDGQTDDGRTNDGQKTIPKKLETYVSFFVS
ncbi:hypothetical protein DPMN_182506 [Dreissena polymorpha]|uniref:Uncharacterized protein n=1 Tax=Dreissena polymorpha TaxID=45954 RepID=A0A9D4DI79_DREPO|nr:hypothetical protein DPMN_182506 [Dreissena polymorpha]